MSPHSPKTALVIGVTGASGAHVAQLLLRRGYRVAGAPGWRGGDSRWLEALGVRDRIGEAGLQLDDPYSVARALRSLAPELIFSLADDPDEARSWSEPIAYGSAEVIGMSRLCAVLLGQTQRIPMIHAIRGPGPGARPDTPAASASLFAAAMVQGYREERGLPISLALVPWSEAPLADPESRLRRMARRLSAAATGSAPPLEIGAGTRLPAPISLADVADGLWRAVSSGVPADYAVAANRHVTLETVLTSLGQCLDLDLLWRPAAGEGPAACAIERRTGRVLVRRSAGTAAAAPPAGGVPVPGWSARASLAELCRAAADAEAGSRALPLDVA